MRTTHARQSNRTPDRKRIDPTRLERKTACQFVWTLPDGKDPVEQNETRLKYEEDEEDDVDLDDEDFGDEDFEDLDIDDDGEFNIGDLDDEDDDPDRQGLIRVVPNAHLVYKRSSDDGTFDELWIYNTSDVIDTELKTRRAILAGTDIPANKLNSPDGSQSYTLWTVGNAQLLHITGLPS